MKTRNRLLLIASALLLAALACLPSGNVADIAATAIQQTVQAAGGSVPAGGLQPISPADLTATSVAANQVPAAETQPTATTQAGAQVPAAVPPSATPIPCEKVSFVKDITIPDNTKLTPGSAFTKTWRLQNVGSCTWSSGYKLVFDRGDAMSGPQEVPLTTGSVAPGQTIDVSVNLAAPANPGSYQGFWKLRNSSGVLFGWGDKANSAFWVKITVEAAAQPPPANTQKTVTLSPTSNGGSVDSNGGSNIGYIPGDDTADLAWVTFMDFSIVDIPPTATIHSATLNLPCQVSEGDPFADLGNLGAYYHYYGSFNPNIYAGVVYDSPLGALSSCAATQLDVTNSLQAIIFGPPYYQVVLAHNLGTDNGGDNDITKINAPTLTIKYTP